MYRGKFTIMAIRQPRYSKEEFAQRGDLIYQTQIRPQVETNNYGKIVAIDIETNTRTGSNEANSTGRREEPSVKSNWTRTTLPESPESQKPHTGATDRVPITITTPQERT